MKKNEFIKSGGLKRYPILEREFVFEPTETESNRFRFGTKYLNIWYNTKRDELYVVEHEKSSKLLSDWITKNAPIEMKAFDQSITEKENTIF